MSVRIALDNAPEFYTNLDFIAGRVMLMLTRPETVSGIVVKLEGESNTALGAPLDYSPGRYPGKQGPGDVLSESHKILYKVQQVYPDSQTQQQQNVPFGGGVYSPLQPGQHQFPFRFKVPINNICGNRKELIGLGGPVGLGGYGATGVRVMDGSKQLMYDHVLRTLPPSFTGFPREAEIRYYIKVTIQRPGLFKENWRFQQGLKFLPIEPPRPNLTNQEAFARRPFTFHPQSPVPQVKQKTSIFFGSKTASGNSSSSGKHNLSAPGAGTDTIPPSIEISARLPHPAILTCNQPVPLRLVAKKLAPSPEPVFLASLEINLVGKTRVKSGDLINNETSRFVVFSQSGLSIPVTGAPQDPVGTETVIPGETVWSDKPLPNTVTPSFLTCNLQRTYELDIKLGLTWGGNSQNNGSGGARFSKFHFSSSNSANESSPSQSIFLPLHFSKVDVYSGIKPPPALLDAALSQQQQQPSQSSRPQQAGAANTSSSAFDGRPPLPVRPSTNVTQSAPVVPQQQPIDPLFPPQLGTLQAAMFEDAPPSYEEAMAEHVDANSGPAMSNRPAYSGQTNENAPSLIMEGKNR